MISVKKILPLFYIVFLVVPVQAQENESQVLVLNSYHRGLEWTDSIMRGIETEFARQSIRPEIHVEYMDTKRHLPATVFPTLYDLYAKKYGETPPELIIVSDDNAYEFILTFREELFPGVPVVFCGVNFFDPARLADSQGITGIVEGFDILGTLEAAVNLHPETEQIFVVNDTTTTGRANRQVLKKIIPRFSEMIDFYFLDALSMEELQGELQTLPPKSLVLLLSFNRDRTGRTFTYQEAIRKIAPHSNAPMYGVWDFYLGRGIVGGKLTRGLDHGRAAATMGLRIMRGETAQNIPVVLEGINSFMFDYPVLRKFGIDIEQLPPGSIIANKPESFYHKNKRLVLAVGGVITALTFLALFLTLNIIKRKRAEENLRESEEALIKHREHLELLVEDRTFRLKEAQAELIQGERLATLGRLTATVSHELRNPLGTIQTSLFSFVESLEQKDPSLAARSIELAERSINRCVGIIEDLNNYASVKELDVSSASVDDWLKTVFDEQNIPDGITCELDFVSGVEASFDQEKLRQVVVNLIDNAIDALQDKKSNGKQLKISTDILDNKYEIRIIDNGIGMTSEIKEQVFEPLFSTKDFGVGLGMVIVQNIVEQHHGEINIESKEGEGTTVTLCLPINFSGERKDQTI